jgi:hypothetical protein
MGCAGASSLVAGAVLGLARDWSKRAVGIVLAFGAGALISAVSALWEDAKLGFDLGIRHHDKWVRSALVTDLGWIVSAMRVFAWVVPGEARVYPVAELEQARAWVAGG